MPYGQLHNGGGSFSIDINALRAMNFGCTNGSIDMPYGQLHNSGGSFSIDMNALWAMNFGCTNGSIDMNALWAIA